MRAENIQFASPAEWGACDSIVKLLKPGDKIISNNDVYGGTYRMFEQVFKNFNIDFEYTDLTNAENLDEIICINTKMIWIETPSNPLLNIIDIKKIKSKIKGSEILLVVDNTFATPALQNPLNLGADIVIHSATKYIGGHSDIILGALITNKKPIYEKLFLLPKVAEQYLDPWTAFWL